MSEVSQRMEMIHTELRGLKKDMWGISPKIAHYKKLEACRQELEMEYFRLSALKGDTIPKRILIPTT